MFCKYCGKEISPYSAFCDQCGGLIAEIPPITSRRTHVPTPTKTALIFSIISLICSNLFVVLPLLITVRSGRITLSPFSVVFQFVLFISTTVFAEIALRKCINAAKAFQPLPKEYSTAKILASVAVIIILVMFAALITTLILLLIL